MNDTDLKYWLRRADAVLAPRAVELPEARALQRIGVRRVYRRRAATVSAAVLGCAVAVTAFYWGKHDPRLTAVLTPSPHITRAGPKSSPADQKRFAALRVQAESYARQAEEQERIVAIMRQSRRLEQLQNELDELEASLAGRLPDAARVQEELHRLAATQLVVAERLVRDFGDTELAADAYRSVINQFPDTRWAAAAKDRLVRLHERL
jgi:hypothetical protein